ncbi:TolC family outer membrane protein [Halioglobus sp. Uisw_031]|jgi:adhesin transport system outer membrane protein|uniref:TolC family outer membrane protein n=1 Tax=Halioglobus sp. Uisw_031 TaxID=3230977 RepID=UPI0039EAB402
MFKKIRFYPAFIVAIIGMTAAHAQTEPQAAAANVSGLKEAITQGVMISPRVNADWYNFAAKGYAEQSARGSYYPSVDLASRIGREDRDTPLIDLGDFGYDATQFSITQMLFDGFATRDEVARLGYDKLSQYYNFKRASEEVALEVAVTYLDTVKYQRLVDFARANLQVHRSIHAQIAERAEGGVSQGVDLDQAVARVGLAETNLVIEVANLNDVLNRFQRLVGAYPGANLAVPAVPEGEIPELRGAALEIAYQRSPVINSAIENLRAAQEALNLTNAPMMPRFDLRYRNEVAHDTDSIDGRFSTEAVELVMTYNLFRGGADSARKREYYNLYNAAIEERKQACLNVRQEISNNFNELAALREQVVLTEVSRKAQNATRKAYRDQFDRGRRSLLDLLDSQNEYFDSERSNINAIVDEVASQARTLANMGLLLASLEVDGLNAEKVAGMDLDLTRDPSDKNTQALCPGEPATAPPSDTLEELSDGSDRYRPLVGGGVALEVDVQFESNSSVITSAYDTEIGVVAQTLANNSDARAVVEGHTDSIGDPKYNLWLSQRRAEAVRQLLIDQYGVKSSQVTAVGRGEESPIANNRTADGRRLNRRVELIMDAE